MTRSWLVLVLALVFVFGCMSPQSRPSARDISSSLEDPRGNLQGDPSRSYMDIVGAEVKLQDDTYVLSVRLASSVPDLKDMIGKRIDLCWFIDIDRDRSTGQIEGWGNDYNIDVWITGEYGVRSVWAKVSDKAKTDGIEVVAGELIPSVRGNTVSLSFPKRLLPSRSFDWWVNCSSGCATNWLPVTENPITARATFALPQGEAHH